MTKSSMKKEFQCNIEILWNMITDNQNYSWRSDLSKIEVVDENHFIEYTKKNFPTYFTITSKKYLAEYQMEFKNSNIKGKWIGILKEQSNGVVELDFCEEVETGNFMMKLLAKPYLKKQQKRYFQDLGMALQHQKE